MSTESHVKPSPADHQLQPCDRGPDRLEVAPTLCAEHAEVRRASQADVLRDRDPLGDHGLLGNQRDVTRPLAASERGERPPPHRHGAVERDQAGDRVQQRRLPGAVRPHHARPRPDRDGQRDVAEDLGVAEPHAEPCHLDGVSAAVFDRGAHATLPLRRSATTKNGAPRNAVITPIGISAGATAVRAPTSTRIRNEAPNRTDSGRTCRDEPPARRRTVWGTMIPTNPIRPATDTAAAVASDAATTTTSRSLATWRPRLSASSSPTSTTSRSRRTSHSEATAITTEGTAIVASSHPVVPSRPRIHV